MSPARQTQTHRHGPASWEPSFKYEKWPHPHPARPDTQHGDINSFVTRWESHKLLTQPNAPDHESPGPGDTGSLLTQRAGQMLRYTRNLDTLHSASFPFLLIFDMYLKVLPGNDFNVILSWLLELFSKTFFILSPRRLIVD